jgi:3D (Asp-Asp-Asp) domain-containing protein
MRVSQLIAIGALCAAFLCAGFMTQPSALAATGSVRRAAVHAVTLESGGSARPYVTAAQTVGDFLREQHIAIGPGDDVDPSPGVPLSDGLVITYRPAIAVTVVTAHRAFTVHSAAPSVGALLARLGIQLGRYDKVFPPLSRPLPTSGRIHVVRIRRWERSETRAIGMPTLHRLDFSLAPGESRIVAKGSPGLRRVRVRFVQANDRDVTASILSSRVLRKPRPRIVAEGVGAYDTYARFAANGIARMTFTARSAIEMVATAYTADCSGCSGVTAIGLPAGHGIVAVDPRVIPLGTRLFIPGYGLAIAGDTGGAIVGRRIDLGFDSERDAIEFGRRDVTVYRLK